MPDRKRPADAAKAGLAGLGLATFAVTCCAAIPLLGALAGGVALATLLGIGGGIIALVLLLSGVVVWARRRRACATPSAPQPSERTPSPRAPRPAREGER